MMEAYAKNSYALVKECAAVVEYLRIRSNVVSLLEPVGPLIKHVLKFGYLQNLVAHSSPLR
jgi:hypothetical protein